MMQDEFVALHGEDLWRHLVKPYQETVPPPLSNNANAIMDEKVMWVLATLGLDHTQGVIGAKAQIQALAEGMTVDGWRPNLLQILTCTKEQLALQVVLAEREILRLRKYETEEHATAVLDREFSLKNMQEAAAHVRALSDLLGLSGDAPVAVP